MEPAFFAIRDSVPADIPAIAAIYAHSVMTSLATFDERPPSVQEMRERWADVVDIGLPFLVAVGADGKILGYAYAAAFRRRTGYRFTLEDSIYIERSMTHRGIGTALLKALIERCAAAGYRQLVAVIADAGQGASIGLHEKLGFKMIGVMPAIGFKFRRWIDVVLMQRALGPADATAPQSENGAPEKP